MSNGSEASAAPPPYEAEDGTLYWTLSFYIPFADIRPSAPAAGAITALPPPFKAEHKLRDVDAGENEATRRVREAIDPLFNDIADRTRQGDVLDRLLVEGQRSTVYFHLPDRLGWKTEGRRFRVNIPAGDRRRAAEMRRYWYLHSDGALSWHVAFAVRYRDALDRELAEQRASTLYFLSALQKLAWPKECDATGITPLTTDNLLNIGVSEGDEDAAHTPFWESLRRWFDDDAQILVRVHGAHAAAQGVSLLGQGKCIEVPGLSMCETRSLFFVQDDAFFKLIQPKTPLGRLVPRRERVLDDVFKQYPAHIKALTPDAEQAYLLDAPFWAKLFAQDSEADSVAAGGGDADDPFPLPDATDRLLYLFLAGFNQNIIDWTNQEASEVLDSLDPIYPASDEQLEEGFFIRYANPRSLITYVPRSRTLEVGNDHILTCPYAFLIHVLAMNNEYLTRQKEKRAFDVIDWVSGQLRTERATDYAAIEQAINRLRIDSFEHFDRHRYANPFRYDTERDVFDELERLRGTSRLEIAYKEALHALEEQTKDLERLQARAAANAESKRNLALTLLFGMVGLSGLGQLAFNIVDYLERDGFADGMQMHDWTPLGIAFLWLLPALALLGAAAWAFFFWRKDRE